MLEQCKYFFLFLNKQKLFYKTDWPLYGTNKTRIQELTASWSSKLASVQLNSNIYISDFTVLGYLLIELKKHPKICVFHAEGTSWTVEGKNTALLEQQMKVNDRGDSRAGLSYDFYTQLQTQPGKTLNSQCTHPSRDSLQLGGTAQREAVRRIFFIHSSHCV